MFFIQLELGFLQNAFIICEEMLPCSEDYVGIWIFDKPIFY